MFALLKGWILVFHATKISERGYLMTQSDGLRPSWRELGNAYRALETSVLPVDTASREPHVRFLKQRTQNQRVSFLV